MTETLDVVVSFANFLDILVERDTSVVSNPEAIDEVRECDWSSSN